MIKKIKTFLCIIMLIILAIPCNIFAADNWKYIVLPEYDDLQGFYGDYVIAQKGEKYGILNRDGVSVVPIGYDSITPQSLNGVYYFTVYKDSKVGLLDNNLKTVLNCEYDYLGGFGYETSKGFTSLNTMAYQKDGVNGFIDKTGKVLLKTTYDETWSFCDGLAVVSKDGKYGFIDMNGKTVINCVFEDVMAFDGTVNLFAVKQGGKWGFADKTGKLIINYEYDNVDWFDDGLCAVNKGDKWGFIDKTGKKIIDFVYADVRYFRNGLAPVTKDGENWGFIDKTGKTVIDLDYIYASNLNRSEGYFECMDADLNSYAFDSKGKKINPWLANGMPVSVYVNNEAVYMDYKGKKIISDGWEYGFDFDEKGYAIVGKADSEKFGFIYYSGAKLKK